MTDAPIKLECKSCGRLVDLDRDSDPTIPVKVAKIVQAHCDVCWDGDFEDETWLDEQDREVPQIVDVSDDLHQVLADALQRRHD